MSKTILCTELELKLGIIRAYFESKIVPEHVHNKWAAYQKCIMLSLERLHTPCNSVDMNYMALQDGGQCSGDHRRSAKQKCARL